MHEFYAKEISSKMVVHARAAMLMQMKRTILTQQMLRVMLNCSQHLEWKETAMHLSEMNNDYNIPVTKRDLE